MSTRLNPYLGFRDTAKDAMTYYQAVFGGELTLSTFRDFHASEDESELDKIMHGMLTTEDGMVIMAATRCRCTWSTSPKCVRPAG